MSDYKTMAAERITPATFFSETPPERYIGTECEYNLQNYARDGSRIDLKNYITAAILSDAGLYRYGQFISNGARLYIDVGHLEYATPECLGPRQAAAADLAGILVMQKIISASKLPHKGLYRLTGSYLPKQGAPLSSVAMPEGNTSGYHENFLIPRSIGQDPLIDRMLPSFLASRIWAMSGTLHNSFVFSQKVWGIGGKPIARQIERRSGHGSKPMAMIPPENNDEGTIGAKEWARLEVRYADAGFSPKGRYLSLAATSLLLRMIEHVELVGMSKLATLQVERPKRAAITFASDLTLRKTVPMCDGRQLSALDIQESYAEAAIDLAEAIELPPSEQPAPHMWMEMCQAMRASRPDEGEYGQLVREIDIAAKHFYLSQRHPQDALSYLNHDAMQRVLVWDRVLPDGGAIKWWQANTSPLIDQSDIDALVTNPPPTRAAARVSYLMSRASIVALDWAMARQDKGKTEHFELYPQ